MTRQLTVPPAHIWDRIEKILDEQDEAKKQTDKLLADTFTARKLRRKNLFLGLITSFGLVALIMLNYGGTLKQS